jgi:uncharacterized protein (UPF0276 family)
MSNQHSTLSLDDSTQSMLTPSFGISFKPQYFSELLETLPRQINWVEVHPENYMSDGGLSLFQLEKIREQYDVSLHGVGLSLGSAGERANNHICNHSAKLAKLKQRFLPWQMSDHISWSVAPSGSFLNDLLPLPLTKEAASILVEHIDIVQNQLGRQILVENPSTYLTAAESDFDEPNFINEVLSASGAGLLLDINNIIVSTGNQKTNPYAYIDAIAGDQVGEIHMAGHATISLSNGEPYLVDDHGSVVSDSVLKLYRYFAQKYPLAPTLMEWDTNPPALSVMLNEIERIKYSISDIPNNSLSLSHGQSAEAKNYA